ncbi:ComF family protein [Peribacillus frigoritolerans]|uniref:ComF family protein n=1 Tax=Peribacillus frigoritolerans TaxID=450367 RepID=UPI00105A19F2|nr:ComF family protein [Peribacillus frigoritolerans]TDL78937.1 ComF family protein [Peribacillus frigoritolerans]
MSKCLICHAELEKAVTWRSVFFLDEQGSACCSDCSSKFSLIEGAVCPMCDRPQSEAKPCYDCERWQADPVFSSALAGNRSVYQYNDFMKELIARYKYRGDAQLADLFSEPLRNIFSKHFSKVHLLVPIPLSKERLYERGFNQARLLADFLNAPIHEPLMRIHLEKQSKKTRMERLQTENVFFIDDAIDIYGKKLLLIDDIYTTGTTIRHAAKLLIGHGAESVSSLTLVRG